ncbi:MAG: TerB family tellurite resistance protein [Alphaproteobacteria bacterium]|nr:TerB family tellurite resistance protein [Alphaproteobacteria bacterium]
MLFRVALAIAAADGEVSDEEKLLLTRVGEALGMDVTEALAGLFEDGPEA